MTASASLPPQPHTAARGGSEAPDATLAPSASGVGQMSFISVGQAWDQAFVAQHPNSIALIRAMRPRALVYATHHEAKGK